MVKVNVKIGDSPTGVRREKMDPPYHQHTSLGKGSSSYPRWRLQIAFWGNTRA